MIKLKVLIKTIVDNEVYDNRFLSTWGLSLYIEVRGKSTYTLLFDVDSSFRIWKYNAKLLDIEPSFINAIVVSHWHGDHAGPLREVLKFIGKIVPVYVPVEPYMKRYRMIRNMIVCSEPCNIYDNILTTGTMGVHIREQALIINRSSDLLIVVGCSHPGITNIVKWAQDLTGVDRVKLVIGGLHISSWNEGLYIAKKLKELGVEYISPMHCTGLNAKLAIREVYGENYIPNGSGKTLLI